MSTDNITRLKEALEAGPTPGPWTADFLSVKRDEHFTIARLHGTTGKCESEEVNAAYIAAANPAAIRELLERLEQAEKDARRWQHMRANGVILDGHDFISCGEIADHRVDAAIASQEGGK